MQISEKSLKHADNVVQMCKELSNNEMYRNF